MAHACTHRPVCNTYSFSTATMIHERYTYIAPLVEIPILEEGLQSGSLFFEFACAKKNLSTSNTLNVFILGITEARVNVPLRLCYSSGPATWKCLSRENHCSATVAVVQRLVSGVRGSVRRSSVAVAGTCVSGHRVALLMVAWVKLSRTITFQVTGFRSVLSGHSQSLSLSDRRCRVKQECV